MSARVPDNDTPLHLTGADFDAYLPERAASQSFGRPRLELKQRLMAWGRRVADRLDEMGVSVEVTASDEQPSVRNGRRVDCQRVFFWRDASSRETLERLLSFKRTLAETLTDPAPHKDHAYLAIRLDGSSVDVSIELHPEAWVDVRNLRARLGDVDRAIELAGALEALPEQFSIGDAIDVTARTPAQSATTDDVRALLDRVESGKRALWIGWSVPRDVAIAHSELLAEQLEDAIVALGPLYKVIAWAPDNDLLRVDREWDAARAGRARAHDEAEKDRAEWESRREGERRVRAKDRADAPPWRPTQPERPRDEEVVVDGSPTIPAPPPEMMASPSGPRRFGRRPPRSIDVDPSIPIEKGGRVVVLAGPFEGKHGIVGELDGRGGARVMLGLLAIRSAVTDLVASTEGRDRPVLSSSHRKRNRARS
jgi:hypothetical protein